MELGQVEWLPPVDDKTHFKRRKNINDACDKDNYKEVNPT